MLCSLYLVTKNIEGILFDQMKKCETEKEAEYSKLPFRTIEHMYNVLEVNLSSNYKFTPETKILVMNCESQDCTHAEFTQKQCTLVNSHHNLEKGGCMYNLIFSSQFK